MSTSSGRAPLDTTRPLSIAIMALGGQGGGVLVDWLVALCEANGWVAQASSVPGVAQRTGATVYYIETLSVPPAARGTLRPVLGLMAAAGEVDVVVAAEWMEAGRAILRGLVTPDRTTLIASTHRAYAVVEKQTPGDGIADPVAVFEAAKSCARRLIAFDMAAVAEETRSAISAVLFGAIAASKVLPFARESYEAVIRSAGIGVEASLRGFARGYERATLPLDRWQDERPAVRPALAPVGHAAFDALVARARDQFPAPCHDMLAAGLARVVDFQDVDYGRDYLDLLAGLLALDRSIGGEARGFALTRTAAKYVALAMAYDDVYRVAELKTRGSRFSRVRREVAAAPDQLLDITDYMHPRMDEIAGSLPAPLGRFIARRPRLFRALDRLVNRGRRVRTSRLGGFLLLYALAGLRRFRRGTLRHQTEMAHRDAWLARVREAAAKNYDLALELLACRRLVKGYSDTYSRGRSKFDRVMAAAKRLEERNDAAAWVRRLREAALRDEDGAALDGALKTVESFL
ncbi:MAG: indolepyruvate oxidoreductase subunit beta family protein [Pseudolabrys sp.]|nr:indolepyruvate oxidoreductase subunit beta family protein [Pseudolabrys sp.]